MHLAAMFGVSVRGKGARTVQSSATTPERAARIIVRYVVAGSPSATAYRAHAPGTPLSSWSPSASNRRPEPTTRSVTVHSEGPVVLSALLEVDLTLGSPTSWQRYRPRMDVSIETLVSVRTVLGEAFATDPLFEWVFPDAQHRRESTAAWLGLLVEGYLGAGRVDTIEDEDATVAVAAWHIPSDAPMPMPVLPSVPGLLTALVGNEWAAVVRPGLIRIASVRPPPPFAHLQFLAVMPSHQGRGFGHRVIQPGVDASAKLGLGTQLETMNRRNLPFYRSAGFDITQTITLEPGGPEVFGMWRPPPTVGH